MRKLMAAAAMFALVACSAAGGAEMRLRLAPEEDFERRPRRLKPSRPPRGRGLQAKARKRPNMGHVSKRVRRRHRRAA